MDIKSYVQARAQKMLFPFLKAQNMRQANDKDPVNESNIKLFKFNLKILMSIKNILEFDLFIKRNDLN